MFLGVAAWTKATSNIALWTLMHMYCKEAILTVLGDMWEPRGVIVIQGHLERNCPGIEKENEWL